jgi:pyruvate formate lyase activating enzyme
VLDEARRDVFTHLDAATIDLKSFSDDCYRKISAGRLGPVLDTLRYLRHETDAWLEITTVLIPGHNDGPGEIDALTRWVAGELGPDVPLHFTAFHPDFRMRDVLPTPAATLREARRIGLANGLRFVYVGTVRDPVGGTTTCPECAAPVIERDRYRLAAYRLDDAGRCLSCRARLPGRFDGPAGQWGPRRVPVRPGRPARRA